MTIMPPDQEMELEAVIKGDLTAGLPLQKNNLENSFGPLENDGQVVDL